MKRAVLGGAFVCVGGGVLAGLIGLTRQAGSWNNHQQSASAIASPVAAKQRQNRHNPPQQWNFDRPRRGRGWWNRVPPRFPDPDAISDGSFSFARILYQSVRDEPLGHGWNTDYPDSDVNFMIRFSELTTTRIRRDAEGAPDHVVLRLTDDQLFQYPFVFMSDVGTLGFTQEEAERLRDYLLRGGFLYVDDFWGQLAWEHWKSEMAKVLNPSQYPIVDIPRDHAVFQMFFTIREIPQIPSIQHWRWSDGAGTSERGFETDEAHFRGIFDESGRLMVAMTHNTDIADGWEREGESREFFYRFSVKAYPVGVNIVLYSMTH